MQCFKNIYINQNISLKPGEKEENQQGSTQQITEVFQQTIEDKKDDKAKDSENKKKGPVDNPRLSQNYQLQEEYMVKFSDEELYEKLHLEQVVDRCKLLEQENKQIKAINSSFFDQSKQLFQVFSDLKKEMNNLGLNFGNNIQDTVQNLIKVGNVLYQLNSESKSQLRHIKDLTMRINDLTQQCQNQESSIDKFKKEKIQDQQKFSEEIQKVKLENKEKIQHYDQIKEEQVKLQQKLEENKQQSQVNMEILKQKLEFQKNDVVQLKQEKAELFKNIQQHKIIQQEREHDEQKYSKQNYLQLYGEKSKFEQLYNDLSQKHNHVSMKTNLKYEKFETQIKDLEEKFRKTQFDLQNEIIDTKNKYFEEMKLRQLLETEYTEYKVDKTKIINDLNNELQAQIVENKNLGNMLLEKSLLINQLQQQIQDLKQISAQKENDYQIQTIKFEEQINNLKQSREADKKDYWKQLEKFKVKLMQEKESTIRQKVDEFQQQQEKWKQMETEYIAIQKYYQEQVQDKKQEIENIKKEHFLEILKINQNQEIILKNLEKQHEKEIEKAVEQIKNKKNEIEQYIHDDLVQYEQNSLYWQKAQLALKDQKQNEKQHQDSSSDLEKKHSSKKMTKQQYLKIKFQTLAKMAVMAENYEKVIVKLKSDLAAEYKKERKPQKVQNEEPSDEQHAILLAEKKGENQANEVKNVDPDMDFKYQQNLMQLNRLNEENQKLQQRLRQETYDNEQKIQNMKEYKSQVESTLKENHDSEIKQLNLQIQQLTQTLNQQKEQYNKLHQKQLEFEETTLKQHQFVQDLKQQQLRQEQIHQNIVDKLKSDLRYLQILYEQRPSRSDDLEKIKYYMNKFDETEGIITQLKLEMHNREDTYNKRLRGKLYFDDINQMDNDSPTAILDISTTDLQPKLTTDFSSDNQLNQNMVTSYQSDFFKVPQHIIIKNDTIKFQSRCNTSSKQQRYQTQSSSIIVNQTLNQKSHNLTHISTSTFNQPPGYYQLQNKTPKITPGNINSSLENSKVGFFNYINCKKFGIKKSINRKSKNYIKEMNQSYCM